MNDLGDGSANYRLGRLEGKVDTHAEVLSRLDERSIAVQRSVEGIHTRLDEQDEEERNAHMGDRRALWAAASLIVASIIGAAATILVAGPH